MESLQIVDVVPITRGALLDHVSYFTTQAVQPGAIVSAMLRHRLIHGLVVGVHSAKQLKLNIKSADFNLKKITQVKHRRLFTPEFLDAVYHTAEYFAGPPGPILKQLIPQTILEAHTEITEPVGTPAPSPAYSERFATQDIDRERMSFYRGLIRETFAKNASVFICQPTIADIDYTLTSLEKGIKEYTVVLHHRLKKGDLLKAWNEALRKTHPLVIIGTPLFLSLPRADIQTLIIDHESSAHYKLTTRPFSDARFLAEQLARRSGWRLIRGDVVLSTETAYHLAAGDYLTALSVKQRLISEAATKIIPLSKFEIITEELAKVIETAHRADERVLILSGRRGLAPLIVCDDCQYPITCERCAMPIALHRRGPAAKKELGATILICHRCGQTRKVNELCPSCGSWRLRELGVGIDKVFETVTELLPEASRIRLDSDSVATPARAQQRVNKFLASPGSVLVGTEMALNYLRDKIETVIVVGLDSLLLRPDFRSRERLFTNLIRARSLASKRFLIQTRRPDETLFQQALQGNILDFYREEVSARQRFDYPPFRTLIKISRLGARELVTQELQALADYLKAYQPIVFPALQPDEPGKYQQNLIMKIDPAGWPEPELLRTLRELPANYKVTVDPEHIF